jgi:predicted transcriptional regulator
MNVPVQLETRLEALAQNTGRPADTLLCEAIERYAEEEERFLEAMKEGIAAADRGEFVDNEEVRKWVYRRAHV